jgi:hypothetical protein
MNSLQTRSMFISVMFLIFPAGYCFQKIQRVGLLEEQRKEDLFLSDTTQLSRHSSHLHVGFVGIISDSDNV